MRRAKSSPSAHSIGAPVEMEAERLQSAVEELSQNVQILTDIVDQIREDLSWLTRNGVTIQPVTVLVHRMPRVLEKGSHGPRETRRGSLEITFAHFPDHDPTADTLSDDQIRVEVIEDVVQRLAEPLGELAQEQLNILVGVVDHAHRELLKAILQPCAVSPVQEPADEEPSAAKPRRPKAQRTTPATVVSDIHAPAAASAVPIVTEKAATPEELSPPRGQLF